MKKIILPLLLSAGIAGFSNAEPFVVQGQLRDNGSVANGLYDFEFELWDAVTGGNQVGITLTVDDLDVVAGVFTSEIDFGAVFNGNSFWVETRIRAGGSTGAFSPLPSRILIGSAPQAHHATTADSLINPQWNEAPGVLWYGSGSDQVFINRSNPILSSEVFGVQTNSGFSGIVVSGPSSTDSPYIALATDNSVDVYESYDGSSDTWVFWKSGAQRLTIDSTNEFNVLEDVLVSGNVDVVQDIFAQSNINVTGTVFAEAIDAASISLDGDATAADFVYSVRKAGSATASVNDFLPSGAIAWETIPGVPTIAVNGLGAIGVITSQISIVDGATIDGISVIYYDNSGFANLIVSLVAESHQTGDTQVLARATPTASNSINLQTRSDPSLLPSHIIDNASNTYYIEVGTNMNNIWPGSFPNLIGVRMVLINYTVSSPS